MTRTVRIRYNSNHPITIEADPKWPISRLKEELGKRLNIPANEVRIIHQGRVLADMVPINQCDLGSDSVMNAIKNNQSVTLDAKFQRPLESVAEMSLEENAEAEAEASDSVVKPAFYVYCKAPCKSVQQGKIRVRCKTCGDSAFVLDRDPECFEDVIEPDKMRGNCHNENCEGKVAEFFFKCKNHDAKEFDTAGPLTMVRSNTHNVECAVCCEEKNPVLVFECSKKHVMCVDCFSEYCQVKLNERSFTQDTKAGYTVPCPGTDDDCNKAYITEGRHFRLMGPEQYDRYQRFGAEEWILQEGGVLCPNIGCGVGILTENTRERRVKCEKQGFHGCGFEFCRICKQAYHSGDCGSSTESEPRETEEQDEYRLNPEGANRGRWDLESLAAIRQTTKNCPRCRVPVEKNGGCMHMTCTQPSCKFGWCWICEIEWNGSCQQSHWFGE